MGRALKTHSRTLERKGILMNIVLLLALVFLVALVAGGYWVFQNRRQRASLFDVIEKLTRERPTTLVELQRLTGSGRLLPLQSGIKSAASGTSRAVFAAGFESHAPIEWVEVGVPDSMNSKAEGIVSLSVNRELRIKARDVEKRFGPMSSGGVYQHPWGTVQFEFEPRSQYLTNVVIHTTLEPWVASPATRQPDARPFAIYPGARLLCSQAVDDFAHGVGFTWYAYVTEDLPEKVIDFYLQKEKEGSESVEVGKDSLRIHRGNSLLSVHRASANDYPRCDKAPGPGDNTVIIVS